MNLNEEAYRREYSDDGGERFRRLCSRCSEYNNDKNFDRGMNELIIKAIDYAGNSELETIHFEVLDN